MRNPFARQKQVTKSKAKQAVATATKSETDFTLDIPLGTRINVEFTKIMNSAEVGLPTEGKRVITQKGKTTWKGAKTFIQRGKKFHYIDPGLLKWQPKIGRRKGYWKIQYDDFYCEPLGRDNKPHRSPIVSKILRDESMMQLIQIAQLILPIQITRTMAIVIIIFSTMAGFMALAITPFVAPTTVIHWFNSPVKIGR